jgi:membrane-bound serine protease (ClpP class)
MDGMGRSRLSVWAGFLLAACLGVLLLGALATPALAAGGGATVATLSVSGPLDPFEASYIQRGLQAAAAAHDAAAVLMLDTSGGLDSSMRQAVQAVLASRVPVLCYVPPGARAASEGTFLMFACPVNGMAPGSEIGAARPVGFLGALASSSATTQDAAFLASLATAHGRNATWAQQAVRDSVSLDAGQAVAAKVVDYQAPSLRGFLAAAGECRRLAAPAAPGASVPASGAEHDPAYTVPTCGATPAAFAMTPGEGIFHTFADPDIAFVLLDIGFLALIVWAFHPGIHTSLGVAAVSMALGLAIMETLPVRLAGFALLAVAAVLLVLDVRAKAHGILTAGGVVVLILGGLLLFNPAVPRARVSPALLIALPVVLGIATALLLRAIAEAKEEPLHAGVGALAGEVGRAETALAPSGRVRLHGESWAAVSPAGDVPAGAPVRVVGVTGLTLEVEQEPPGDGDAAGVGAQQAG